MKHSFIFLILVFGFVSCKSPEARLPESVQSGSFIKKSAERNKKLNEKERKQIKMLIDKDVAKAYISSKNGFWYTYNTQITKDTITPQFGDRVNFDYNLSTLDGDVIYTKKQLGNRDYLIDKEVLFLGLREGLKLMKPTEEVTFIFPSHVAYGYYGDENKIGTNVPLICKVNLNTITKNSND